MVPYCYGAEQVSDAGWGCVYRSWQNALLLQELPHESISSLFRSVHNPSSRWIEPPQLLPVLPIDAYADTALGVFEDGKAEGCCIGAGLVGNGGVLLGVGGQL